MRVVFAGTLASTIPIIETIARNTQKCSLVAIYTQPDRKAGRGRKPRASAVKQWALARGYSLEQPAQWDEAAIVQLRQYRPDLLIVAAYGVLLPQAVINLPSLACMNIHTSLLPRWRGAAPVVRAIQHGDTVTGVSLMRMRLALDTGEIISQNKCPISEVDTAGTLCQKLMASVSTMLEDFLKDAASKIAEAKPQSDAGVCYAQKITKQEAWIDWNQSARQIVRQVRAFNPIPVAQTYCQDSSLRVWRAAVFDSVSAATPSAENVPGEIIAVQPAGIAVRCGKGIVSLTEVQLAGRKVLPAFSFAQGYDLAGVVLGKSLQDEE